MTAELSPIDLAKSVAAQRATEFVETGMKVGLGTGSTAAWLVRHLGRLAREEGLKITAVATSSRTRAQAEAEGIEVVSLDDAGMLDITIDGADEFDAKLSLIKGGGGAHLQEKIVAMASERMVVIADISKEVQCLGAFPLPVEVIPFGMDTTKVLIEEALQGLDVLGREVTPRMVEDKLFVTDEGNHIFDLKLGRISNPTQLSLVLNQIPGVVENGLFIDICDTVVIGYGDGSVEVRDLASGTVEQERIAGGEPDNLFSDIAE